MVRTRSITTRIIGEARSAFEDAAGANALISPSEARRLPADLASAVTTARRAKTPVTVDEAVDAYARKLTRVLSAVDTRSPGVLTEQEARKIRDPALRTKVLDVRAQLARGAGSGGSSGGGLSLADATAALGQPVATFDGYHESGDHGVEVTAQALDGTRSLTKALEVMTPGGVALTLDAARGADAIATFRARAEATLEGRADAEGQDPANIGPGLDAITQAFSALGSIRSASASDGGAYLFGKAADGYVALRVVDYSG